MREGILRKTARTETDSTAGEIILPYNHTGDVLVAAIVMKYVITTHDDTCRVMSLWRWRISSEAATAAAESKRDRGCQLGVREDEVCQGIRDMAREGGEENPECSSLTPPDSIFNTGHVNHIFSFSLLLRRTFSDAIITHQPQSH